MRRIQQHRSQSKASTGFWQSYSDMMAALLLLFVLALTGVMYHARREFEVKQEQVNAQAEIIRTQEEQLEEILGVRKKLIEAIRNRFAGTELEVDAQTGAIRFKSDLMFAFGSSVLTEEGKIFLDQFLPGYFAILLGDDFLPYIGEIIVEGHTDSVGSYISNLNLSQSRAYSVAAYFLADDQTMFQPEELTILRQITTANGRSWSFLILNPDGTENAEASRRVEILFRLKDEEMIREMAEVIR